MPLLSPLPKPVPLPLPLRAGLAGLLVLSAGLAAADTGRTEALPPLRPEPLRPEAFRWVAPEALPGLRAAWVIGSQTEPGPYLLRVELAAGTRVLPHRHPDRRVTTVLRGTLYVGFGERADDAALVAIPEGALYVAPAGVAHFLWAKDGPVQYQENGTAPTGTAPILPPADAAR